MATPEAKQQRLDRSLRAMRYLAEEYGTPDEVERFNDVLNQPTMGDPDFEKIYIAEATVELWQHFTGIEVPEEVIMADEKIYEYDPNQDKNDEPSEAQEWSPSYLAANDNSGQGQGA